MIGERHNHQRRSENVTITSDNRRTSQSSATIGESHNHQRRSENVTISSDDRRTSQSAAIICKRHNHKPWPENVTITITSDNRQSYFLRVKPNKLVRCEVVVTALSYEEGKKVVKTLACKIINFELYTHPLNVCILSPYPEITCGKPIKILIHPQ